MVALFRSLINLKGLITMVAIKKSKLNIHKLKKDDFLFSNEERALNIFLVEDEGLIIVEYLFEDVLNSVFFRADNLKKIPTEFRFEEFNGKTAETNIENHQVVEKIEIDLNTGNEFINGFVIKQNEVVYQCRYGRYNNTTEPTLWERFKFSEEQFKINEMKMQETFSTFKDMVFNEKVNFLRGKFRKIYKSRWELGLTPEECFMSKIEVEKYAEDELFLDALKKVLQLEKNLTNKTVQEMYFNITFQGKV